MFLVDPVLATVTETSLEQSIVLLDCCCVNDPCDVSEVLWNEKLKQVSSSLWQKLQERKFLDGQRSPCMSDWALTVCFSPRAASSRYVCPVLVPTILVHCLPPLFFFYVNWKEKESCRWIPFNCDACCSPIIQCVFWMLHIGAFLDHPCL